MSCSGATHKFQYSSTALEYLPSLSNMKSKHLEGIDIFVFKLTCSYPLPRKLNKSSHILDEFLFKEISIMRVVFCLVVFISGQNCLWKRKGITRFFESLQGFFLFSKSKVSEGIFLCHHQRKHFWNRWELSFFQSRKWTCRKSIASAGSHKQP